MLGSSLVKQLLQFQFFFSTYDYKQKCNKQQKRTNKTLRNKQRWPYKKRGLVQEKQGGRHYLVYYTIKAIIGK